MFLEGNNLVVFLWKYQNLELTIMYEDYSVAKRSIRAYLGLENGKLFPFVELSSEMLDGGVNTQV